MSINDVIVNALRDLKGVLDDDKYKGIYYTNYDTNDFV